MTRLLSAEALHRALSLPDLTNPANGPHALQCLLDDVVRALERSWGVPVGVHRMHPVVSVEDNYDRLRIGPAAVSRAARYTRYVSETCVLRTHTSSMVPPLLRALAGAPSVDVGLACPGLVYRRDCVDRLHVGEPHQLELWRVSSTAQLGPADLEKMAATVLDALLPGRRWTMTETDHPYTRGGRQIDVEDASGPVEIGECGLAHEGVLANAGLGGRGVTGLAMGLGLDRVLMLRKGVDDIRLLRAGDARIADQMRDLSPYRPVSMQPPVRRDLSIVVKEDVDAEQLGDRAREALGEDAGVLEEVSVRARTAHASLPRAARERLQTVDGDVNLLVRLVLRHPDRSLTDEEANVLRDRVYGALHEGRVSEWIGR